LYRINFYVPAEYLETVKNALFEKGAGRLGDYQKCCWQTKGVGQFMPLENSNAFIGETNKLHVEPEYKVEITCPDNCLQAALQTLVDTHPYEEPAYEAYKITTLNDDQ
jgi:hypothetical protein